MRFLNIGNEDEHGRPERDQASGRFPGASNVWRPFP